MDSIYVSIHLATLAFSRVVGVVCLWGVYAALDPCCGGLGGRQAVTLPKRRLCSLVQIWRRPSSPCRECCVAACPAFLYDLGFEAKEKSNDGPPSKISSCFSQRQTVAAHCLTSTSTGKIKVRRRRALHSGKKEGRSEIIERTRVRCRSIHERTSGRATTTQIDSALSTTSRRRRC